MKKGIAMALVILSINVAGLFLTAKPVIASTCGDGLHDGASYALRLEHGRPVTLNYEAGQTVMLAGNANGTADLKGNSVVGVYFPNGQGIGYSMEPETLEPQDVTSLLQVGENEVKLVAVDPDDVAFLIISKPCFIKDAEGQVVSTSTPEPMPTPTLTASAIIASSATVGHTPEPDAMVSSDEAAPSASGDVSPLEWMFSRRIGRILITLVLLGLLLISATGGYGSLRRRIGLE